MSSFNIFNRLALDDSNACEQPVQTQQNTMSLTNKFNNLLSEDSDSEDLTVVSRIPVKTNTPVESRGATAANSDWQLAKSSGKNSKKSEDKTFRKDDRTFRKDDRTFRKDDKTFKKDDRTFKKDDRTRENTNQVFINSGTVRYDINKASVHPKVYNYIKDVFKSKSPLEGIHAVMNIGVSRIDKIIGLANLFFLAVRGDKIAIMQNIIDMVQRGERQFIANAYDRKYSPIMQAAYNGCDQSVKLLLIWGADTKQINCDGEDVFSAAQSGMEMMIQNHPSMEILIEAKFKKITDFITSWDPTFSDDFDNPESDSVFVSASALASVPTSIDEVSYEYKLINPSDDIVPQFTEILGSCIDDCNNITMKKLFDDINNLIVNGFDIEKIRSVIEENRECLEEDFSTEFSLLAI